MAPADLPLEIIIVGNLHNDPAKAVVEDVQVNSKFPIHWHGVGKIGVNRARNLGWRQARGGVVLFLDDDCEISSPDFLREHWHAHLKYKEAAAFGGSYELGANSSLYSRAYHRLSQMWVQQGQLAEDFAVRLLGGNTSYKKKFLEAEPFNERIIFGGAETELNERLFRRGCQLVFAKQNSLRHFGQMSFFDFLRKAALQGRAQQELEWSGNAVSVVSFQASRSLRAQLSEIPPIAGWGFALEILLVRLYLLVFRAAGEWLICVSMSNGFSEAVKLALRRYLRKIRLPADWPRLREFCLAYAAAVNARRKTM